MAANKRRADTAVASHTKKHEIFYIKPTSPEFDVACFYNQGQSGEGLKMNYNALRSAVSRVHGDGRDEQGRVDRVVDAVGLGEDWLVFGAMEDLLRVPRARSLLDVCQREVPGYDASYIATKRAAEGSDVITLQEEEWKRALLEGVPASMLYERAGAPDVRELVFDGRLEHMAMYLALGWAALMRKKERQVMCMVGQVGLQQFVVYCPSISGAVISLLCGKIASNAFVARGLMKSKHTSPAWTRFTTPLRPIAQQREEQLATLFMYDLVAHYLVVHLETTATRIGTTSAFFKPLDNIGAVTPRFLVDIGTDQINGGFGVQASTSTNKNNKFKATGEVAARLGGWAGVAQANEIITTSIQTSRKIQTWIAEVDPDVVRLQRIVIMLSQVPEAIERKMYEHSDRTATGSVFRPFMRCTPKPLTFSERCFAFVGRPEQGGKRTIWEQLEDTLKILGITMKFYVSDAQEFTTKRGGKMSLTVSTYDVAMNDVKGKMSAFLIEDNLEMQRLVSSPTFETNVAGGLVNARTFTNGKGSFVTDIFRISKDLLALECYALKRDLVDAVYGESEVFSNAYFECGHEWSLRATLYGHPLFNELASLSLGPDNVALSALLCCSRWHDICGKLRIVGVKADGNVSVHYSRNRRFNEHGGAAHTFLFAICLLKPNEKPTSPEFWDGLVRERARAGPAYEHCILTAERCATMLYSCHAPGAENVRIGNALYHLSAVSPVDNHSGSLVGVHAPMFACADNFTLKLMRDSLMLSPGRRLTRSDLKTLEQLWTSHPRRLTLFEPPTDYHRTPKLDVSALGFSADLTRISGILADLAKVMPSFSPHSIGRQLDVYRQNFVLFEPTVFEINTQSSGGRRKEFVSFKGATVFVFRKYKLQLTNPACGVQLPSVISRFINDTQS